MIEAHVSDHMMIDGIAIWITLRMEGQNRRVLRPGEQNEWEEIPDPLAQVTPTLTLPEDAARALLDRLLRHYQEASDMDIVRADLLHERRRIDKLAEAIIQIAEGRSAA